MAKKKVTPSTVRQGQTLYYVVNHLMYNQPDKCHISKMFICSEKIKIPSYILSWQYPRSRIIHAMYHYDSKFFPTYRSAVRWATDRKLTIVE